MNQQLKKLVSLFPSHGIDALLVTKDVNIRYLTNFPASESWLLVTPKKTFYITDFRYMLEAQKGLKGITITRYKDSHAQAMAQLAGALRVKRIGFDDRFVSVALFRQMKKECGTKIKLLACNSLVEAMRAIKTPQEISLIRQALKINLQAYAFLRKVVKPGMTEQEVLGRLEQFIKERKVGFAFDPIIASGPNSAFPHARVTDRKIKRDEPLLIDMGIDVKGYKSDLTRIFFLGKIPRPVREIYKIVETAQQKAIRHIGPGVKARDVDFQARNYFKQHRLDKYFGHSLGHGVGLEIHEDPRLSPKSPTTLQENMVVTVEPALYLPNKFGIRIEDMVLVTKKGYEVLSGH